MKFKKVVSLALATILSASIVGCASTTSSGGSGAATTAQSATQAAASAASAEATSGAAAEDTDTAASGGKVSLEFFNMKTEIADLMTELIKEYETSNPNVSIDLVTPSDAYTVLSTRMASGDTPDIFTMWPQVRFFTMVDSGYVMDLSKTGILDNIKQSARSQWVYNGGEYAATISYNFGGIWYNKDIFAKCGIDSFPTTWADFKTACDTLKKNGYTPLEIPGQTTDKCVQLCYLTIPSCFNDEEYKAFYNDYKNKSVDVNSQVYGSAIDRLGDRLSTFASIAQSDILGTDDSTGASEFAVGHAAMELEGTWKLVQYKSANPDFNCEIAPVPGETAGDTRFAAYPGDFSLCLSSSLTGEKKDAAIKFLTWLASPEVAEKYAESDGSPSCVEGVDYVSSELKYAYDNYLSKDNYVLNPDSNWDAGQTTAVGAAVQQIFYNNDVDAFKTALQSAFNDN